MPATAPIPAGAAQGHDDDYERFLVASGPYMFEGSQDLDFTLPPSEQVPVTGYAPHRGSAILVRDPSWKPGTDAIRGAYVDRIEVALYGFDDDDQSRRDRLAHLERGELDVLLGDSLTPEEVQRYRADPALVGGVVAAQVSGVSWLDLNLGMPPFDDLHVRRAILYAIDRDEIVRAVGTTFWGFSELAEHLAPDSLEGELLGAYDPYPEHGGDLEAATREMAESAYDHDGDGRCDDPACRSVPIVGQADYTERGSDEAFLVMRSLQAIGIRLDVRLAPDRSTFGELFATGKYAMAIEIDNEWDVDFPNGSSFFIPLFGSSHILPSCCNRDLVGASQGQLRSLGLRAVQVPSVDERMRVCQTQTGSAQTACWAALDQFMMERVVPAVPILIRTRQTPFSTRVVHASIDQWTTMPALDQVALAPGSA